MDEIKMPATTVEKRVRYIIIAQDYPGKRYIEHTFNGDGWFSGDEDGVANYPWMMNTCIAWVEERVVYEPEPWESADIDRLIEKEKE